MNDSDPAPHSLDRARAAISLGRHHEALELAGVAVAENPSNPQAHVVLVGALSGLGRLRDALAAAQAGLGHAPDSGTLHAQHSLILHDLGRFRESVAAADEAIRLSPHSALAFYARGLALAGLKAMDRARTAHEEAVRLDPGDADYRRALGNTFLASHPRTAESHFRASLELDPTNALTLNNLGVALERQKRPLEAAAAFKAAILMDPTLEVAKQNVKSTVDGLLAVSGGSLFGVYFLFRFAGLAAKGTTFAAIPLVVALVLAIVWLVRRQDGKRQVEANRAALERLDPQIFEIYRRLEAEKKWRWKS